MDAIHTISLAHDIRRDIARILRAQNRFTEALLFRANGDLIFTLENLEAAEVFIAKYSPIVRNWYATGNIEAIDIPSPCDILSMLKRGAT